MLRFVVALQAEARPLIERYGLARDPRSDAFPWFQQAGTSAGDTALIVSGPGKTAAAAATAYLHLRTGGERHAVWINAGVAGHGSRAVGEAVIAHTIVDRASGAAWYPPHVFPLPVEADRVTTVDTVERRFQGDGAFEMEASGFYPTACRFSTSELVHSFKIVSDGPGDVPERLTPRRLTELVAGRIEEIAKLADASLVLSDEMRRIDAEPPELAPLVERWHFTVTQRRQLRRLLERWQTLAPQRPLPDDEWAELRRGKDVIRRLNEELDALSRMP